MRVLRSRLDYSVVGWSCRAVDYSLNLQSCGRASAGNEYAFSDAATMGFPSSTDMIPGCLSNLCALSWIAFLSLGCVVTHGFQAETDVKVGSTLTPAQTAGWISLHGTFKFAFYEVPGSGEAFFLGILYDSIGKQTVVWTAGTDLQVDRGAYVELTADGNLALFNNSGSPPVWSSGTRSLGVTSASMRDDGNFALYNSSGGILWQSFDNPTDTLLPGQFFRLGQTLQSRSSPYSANMQTSGNLSLMYQKVVSYWTSDIASTTELPAYASLQTFGFGLYTEQGEQVEFWHSKDYTQTDVVFRRVTLDGDGNLRMYSWLNGSSDWSLGWQAVQDQCEVFGYCGENALCTYNGSGPICVCVEQAGYVPIDPGSPRKGCEAPAGAGGNSCSAAASMVEVNHTTLVILESTFYYGETDCQQVCLTDAFCSAACYLNDGSGICHMQMQNAGFFSGYQEPSLASTSFFKSCGPADSSPLVTAATPPSSPSSWNTSKVSPVVPVVVSILSTLACFILLQAAVWYCCCRRNPWFQSSSLPVHSILDYASGAPVQFSYRELQIATQNFHERLGEGGSGAVYKGLLPNHTEVAVKQLVGIDPGDKQFRREVAIIGSTHHMNLVRLCGFCADAKHRLLVYEFLKNGSLDRYLFEESNNSRNLQWETRFNVLLGTARGVVYLHQECRNSIIHCDIKPENILLDDNFCAKVSDFGLAKLTNVKDRARNLTTVRGTRGYLAPEWRSNLPITAKSDVFSFGMVVLETISGRKNFDTSNSPIQQSFCEWAFHEYFDHQRVDAVVDQRLGGELNLSELDRALKVAFWCMQVQPSLRPSMSKVIQMLDGTLPVEVPPMPRSFAGSSSEETAVAISQALEEERPSQRRSLLSLSRLQRSHSLPRTTNVDTIPFTTFSVGSETAAPLRF